ncbi:tail fiber domain-containing protein [Ensifer sp. ENS04]|uniref:tail fiber domain-containing protein n=1 Tax=Ensifer sp. ENS04 TaxID=2769281 RepID=UPI001780D958|nr:tail fiber domain-containing protein [Ensifer sp. ENS04]MBD9542223.1 tail fiber domain-containing protein [Ensifer sp. ENS04]
MSYSLIEFGSKVPGDTIIVPFPFRTREEVFVVVGDADVSSSLYSWVNDGLISCGSGFPSGAGKVERRTSVEEYESSQSGSSVYDWRGANGNFTQNLFIHQENVDREAKRNADVDEIKANYPVILEARDDAESAKTAAEAAKANAELAANSALAAANAGYKYSTEALFTASTIPAPLLFVDTAGYYSAGDGGGHQKVRISAPGSPLPHQKQSADGSWWEIVGDVDPKFFGARGRGKSVSNDTAAIQAAINTGRNVQFSSGNYYFTNLVINSRGQRLYSKYSLPVAAEVELTAPEKRVVLLQADLNDGQPRILVNSHQNHFDGLAFDGTDRLTLTQTCIRFAKLSNTDDTDGYVTNCIFFNYTKGVEHVGRALTATNNIFVSTNYPITLDWPTSGTDYTAVPQELPWGHRACRIIGNRFHSCQQGIVSVGAVLRGALIALNMGDIGDRLFEGTGGVDRCLFYGNIFDQCNKSVVFISGPVTETEFAANSFGGMFGNGDESPFAGIHIEDAGLVRGLLVNGNKFIDMDAYALTIQGSVATTVTNVTFSANMCRNIGADGGATRAVLASSFSIDGLIFTNNNVRTLAAPYVIRIAPSTLALTNSVVMGNVWDDTKTFFAPYVDNGSNTILIKVGALFVDTTGKVGLGTNAPSHKLHVADSGSNVIKVQRLGSTGGAGIIYENTAGSFTVFGAPSAANDGSFIPGTDNTITLGAGANRWEQLYAGTTTISTSDARDKELVSAIEDAVLDAWADVQWCKYRFIGRVRLHVGLVAQQVEEVFHSHGLDPFELGILCYDEWGAQEAEYEMVSRVVERTEEIAGPDGTSEEVVIADTVQEQVLVTPAREAGNRYGIRYEEALALEAAYQRRKLERLEQQLSAMQAQDSTT